MYELEIQSLLLAYSLMQKTSDEQVMDRWH